MYFHLRMACKKGDSMLRLLFTFTPECTIKKVQWDIEFLVFANGTYLFIH